MQTGNIEPDTQPRGWFSRLRYPVALVQFFTPCPWSDLRNFICENEYFRDEVFRARLAWLEEQKILHDIRYDTVELDLEETSPRVYRVFIAFTNTSDAIAYRLRWQ